MDFLIGSGNQVKSYLTFAAALVPLMDSSFPLQQLIPANEINESLRVLRIMSFFDQFIIVNYLTGHSNPVVKTSVVVIDAKSKKMVQTKKDRLDLNFDAETIACLPLDGKASMV